MNPRKYWRNLPLFKKPACVYCGGVATTCDHTPPRCLLPEILPPGHQAMTVPACDRCNQAYSLAETRAWAIIARVSFKREDREILALGGSLHRAMHQDTALRQFIDDRVNSDGYFVPDEESLRVLGCVAQKTAVGLCFWHFGRIVRSEDVELLGIDHTRRVDRSALAEVHRREDGGWPEVTPSGRELERAVQAAFGVTPSHMPRWNVHVKGFFEYLFLRRSDDRLLCAMEFHEALCIVVATPWPTRKGPIRSVRCKRRDGA